MTVRHAKTQISLGIRQGSHDTRIYPGPKFFIVSEGRDQALREITARTLQTVKLNSDDSLDFQVILKHV